MADDNALPPADDNALPPPDVLDLTLRAGIRADARWERPLDVNVREARLLTTPPWVRTLGKFTGEVSTEGWKFPTPPLDAVAPANTPRLFAPKPDAPDARALEKAKTTRLKPPPETVLLKDRLLYLLQPSLESIFAGRQVQLPFAPFPYQLEGIAFLMPRHGALLADEMGLGKTVQTIVSLRLLFTAGLIHRALLVCPKPLVPNWTRELRLWAPDLPFEVIGGSNQARKASWMVSNTSLKIVNYELLTRDEDIVADEKVRFDVVVLDEAQRIKNRESRTARVVRSLKRDRSWALTGTPVENRAEDLISVFAFVDEDRIPPDTPAKRLPALTADCILRRTTEQVLTQMPPKIIRDSWLELSPGQRAAYDLAEKEGVIRLNELGQTLTVQHVFELVMRLKQICNFDPLTGESAKLEQLVADMAEVAASGRKAIVFSQWVEPLETIAKALKDVGPLQYHGKIPGANRQPILDQFRNDPTKHVLLMSYGTGSVGLNLQFSNYVFLFDRWWNPAIEDQAIKRAHRYGQKEAVFVTRFVSQDTIEGRIAAVLDKKRQMFQELIGDNGPPAPMGLSQDEIFGLFDIRNKPAAKAA